MASNLKDDPVYAIIYRYLKGGHLLDLGCGTGLTFFNSQDVSMEYTGVDISDIAIDECKNRYRSIKTNNVATFIAHDIESYTSDRKYDVILFKDTIYYLRKDKVLPILIKLSSLLRDMNSVFIVRIYRTEKLTHIINTIYANFEIIDEHHLHEGEGIVEGEGIIMVFRNRKT